MNPLYQNINNPLQLDFSDSSSSQPDLDQNNAPSARDLLSIITTRYVDAEKVANLKATTIPEIRTILTSLDPYSDYWIPHEYAAYKTRSSRQFFGIDASLTVDPETNFFKVVNVAKNSPAEKAGLRPRDRVIEINGQSTLSMQLITTMKEVDGKEGTCATLTVLHEGQSEPHSIMIPRRKIRRNPVESSKIGDTGYIKLKNFDYETRESGGKTTDGAQLVREAIESLEKADVKGYILDLRNNPGGMVEQAVKIADYFLDEEKPVATEHGRTLRNYHAYETSYSPDLTGGKPLIVLVNEKSASAAELLAGALQDHRRGIIMGQKTYGKGSVQSLYEFKDGSAIKFTTARYRTPDGHEVQGKGITPDAAFGNNIQKAKARCSAIIENLPPEELTQTFGRSVIGQNVKIDWMLVCAIETLQGNPKWTITTPAPTPH